MSLSLIIPIALFLLLIADGLHWKFAVGRELRRHDLVRVRPFSGFVTPTKGYRLIEACTCKRDGKEYRGWLCTQLSLNIVET